jgi:hypothetical protein
MLSKENKKSLCCNCHGSLMLVFAILLVLILLTLVFKAGIMIGSSKAGYYHKGYTSQCGCEFKGSVVKQYEAKAEAMGLTMEEYKEYLIEQKK